MPSDPQKMRRFIFHQIAVNPGTLNHQQVLTLAQQRYGNAMPSGRPTKTLAAMSIKKLKKAGMIETLGRATGRHGNQYVLGPAGALLEEENNLRHAARTKARNADTDHRR